jgi:drug/metabolite transporter (DMT)-like permease
MLLPISLALITFIGWGTGDLFTIVATRKIGATLTTFWVFFFSFLLSLVALFFAPHNFTLITLPLLAFNIFLGILFVSGNVLISEAFRISSAPLVGIIIQAFPAVVLVLSALIYQDSVSALQWAVIAVIFIGIFLCSVDLKKLAKSKNIIDKGTALALVAMVFLSIFFTFSRVLINQYGWFLPSFIATACFPLILIFIKKRKEKLVFPKTGKVVFSVFMVGLLIRAGDFALNYGLSLPKASKLVAPIAGASPVLFVILSALIFKDRLTKQQILGIIVTLVGVLILVTV